MLVNPFTPSEIAGKPDNFFGRTSQLGLLEQSLLQGSVVIQGVIGIGKSSLLARGRLLMEGFNSDHHSKTVLAVGDSEVTSIEDAARLLLESFVQVDEHKKTVKFKLGSIYERESAEICRNFAEGRHLATLKRFIEKEYLGSFISHDESILLAVDEADKCPVPLARLIRSLCTHAQQQGVNTVRFLLAGTSPFFQKMIEVDRGILRFFYRPITLEPMLAEEANELLETKFKYIVTEADKTGIPITIAPEIFDRIVALSGGHPHILQLLGSHLVEHENEDPDGVIDTKDLVNSLRRICYEDRSGVYESTLHSLDLYGKRESLDIILRDTSPVFPTRINRKEAIEQVGKEPIEWLVENDILSVASAEEYGLVDEFLRIRLRLDEIESSQDMSLIERRVIESGSLDSDLEDAQEYGEAIEAFDEESLDEDE